MEMNKCLMYTGLFFTFLFLYIISREVPCIEKFTQSDIDKHKFYYDKLINKFSDIFPDNNRNGGGAQFFKYILDMLNPTQEAFEYYTKCYCAVSGSPIHYERENAKDQVVIEDLDGNKICGDYYRCCIPCNCDIMKYTKVEKTQFSFSDNKKKEYYVITINDPCENPKLIPKEVTSFDCEGLNVGKYTKSGRLMIGILHNGHICTSNTLSYINKHKNTGDICIERNQKDIEYLQSGMGDIFIKLSLAGQSDQKEYMHGGLKNIYGEPLKECRKYKNDSKGSWDEDGFCSERGGGVHQICFDVREDNKNFSVDTGQSNWSNDRVDKNHCMCLGAWSLYKAKQDNNLIDKTTDELNCEAIPEMSLQDNYVNNWNTWNGNELPNQIVNGVNSLMEQCYQKGNKAQKNNLKKTYLNLTNDRSEFWNTDVYNLYNN